MDKRVNIRGKIVLLHPSPHPRGVCAYQGGDYFEFRQDDAGQWLVSQSAEDRLHDPAYVVGRGATMQEAAHDFTAASRRRTEGHPYVPTVTQGCDLAAASIDTLVVVLGEAIRLGYHDARQNHPTRTAGVIGDALGLKGWNGLQQLQLRHAYMAGREQVALEAIKREAR
jgi:hypothetical protein